MNQLVDVASISTHFETLPDPRHIRNRKHLLGDVIVICVAAIICGSEGPTAIHRFAKYRADWLKQHLSLPEGIPSRDCMRRILITLQPEAFQRCFQNWLAVALPNSDNAVSGSDIALSNSDTALSLLDNAMSKRLIAIDGKSCRGSHDEANGLGALHIVSAWASEEGIALGQVATEEKSNEITAIPELLKQIDLKDSIVSIDAMGCQKAIVNQIVKGGGDCVIAVKKNQPKLHDAIEAFFEEMIRSDFEDHDYRVHESRDAGHGRIDERVYFLAKVPKDFAVAKDWPKVKAIGYALRYTQHPDGRESTEIRYYISTRYLSGKRFAESVRGHWGIESMHWVLDVTFREDAQRSKERTLVNNLSWLRRFAVGLLKRHPSKDSIKGKMQGCSFNPEFLTEVLQMQAN